MKKLRINNCSLYNTKLSFGDKKIIFFGKGSWLKAIDFTKLMDLKSQFAYIIDNNPGGSETLADVNMTVYSPLKLKEEKEAIVILTSPIYMYDMYCQLCEMDLSEKIECYSFPFMQMVSKVESDEKLVKLVTDSQRKQKIPKIIHSFWFSGEPKPYSYQKCVDTWKEKLDGYELIEWNKDNYDWHKHPFVEKAIELGAWAVASDFARLDVLNEFGGIYLDMDIEVFKPFDDLLGNDAIFSFSNNIMIDLAIVASMVKNPVIEEMLDFYKSLVIPANIKECKSLFQPILVRSLLASRGINMNGTLQIVDKATVFPQEFFMPQDVILYNEYERTANTYCVHYDNFGWSYSSDNKQEKKKRDNNKLWDLLEDNINGNYKNPI